MPRRDPPPRESKGARMLPVMIVNVEKRIDGSSLGDVGIITMLNPFGKYFISSLNVNEKNFDRGVALFN